MSDTITITVAGEQRSYPQGITGAQLIAAEQVETPQYVTIAYNEELLNSADFAEVALQEGDNVEFLYFMGGGARLANTGVRLLSAKAAANNLNGGV